MEEEIESYFPVFLFHMNLIKMVGRCLNRTRDLDLTPQIFSSRSLGMEKPLSLWKALAEQGLSHQSQRKKILEVCSLAGSVIE